MTNQLDTYCPECDTEVRACLRDQPAMLLVRGDEVSFTETVAICPQCGDVIGDARIEGQNLQRAYEVYRSARGILAPGEIKELRASYGLSLREFSRFLGFGEQTVYRYERGDIPDQHHNTTMLSARSVEGARLLLSQNGARLSARSRSRVEQRIQALTNDAGQSPRSHESPDTREGPVSADSDGIVQPRYVPSGEARGGMYVCEFEFEEDGDHVLCWPFWPGRVDGTQGRGFDDAVDKAADWLYQMVVDCLMRGEGVPQLPKGNVPQRDGRIIVIAVRVSLDEVPAVTAREAARLLGVSGARVAQLCDAGLLDSWKVGHARMVSIDSINQHLADERKVGTPKKRLAIA